MGKVIVNIFVAAIHYWKAPIRFEAQMHLIIQVSWKYIKKQFWCKTK